MLDSVSFRVKASSNSGTILRSIVSVVAISVLISVTPQEIITSDVRAQVDDQTSPNVGSVEEYVRQESPNSVHVLPGLGLEVSDGIGRLATGASLRGITVMRVDPNGPAARAGLSDERTIGKSLLVGAFVAGSLFFPPALLGAIALSASDVGESHDTIIAVDSERTHDVQELESELGKSGGGSIVYLSVVRGGHRDQIQLLPGTGNDQTK